jgi:hypothetical protein
MECYYTLDKTRDLLHQGTEGGGGGSPIRKYDTHPEVKCKTMVFIKV